MGFTQSSFPPHFHRYRIFLASGLWPRETCNGERILRVVEPRDLDAADQILATFVASP